MNGIQNIKDFDFVFNPDIVEPLLPSTSVSSATTTSGGYEPPSLFGRRGKFGRCNFGKCNKCEM